MTGSRFSSLFAVCLAALLSGPVWANGTNPAWAVYFSPQGGCTAAIVAEIAKARTTIHVQAYSFTSDTIAKALLNAHKQGVKVSVILDKSQRTGKYSSADFFAHSGIETMIDAQHAIAHNKVIVIDENIVITGSFNFTKAAESNNAENILVIRDPTLAEKYLKNWKTHAAHSDIYEGK
ncbi:MAG: phospholipase D family protein [bacterium]